MCGTTVAAVQLSLSLNMPGSPMAIPVVQTAIATDAAQEAEGARRAVADVLEGRRAIAEENIALEEQLLELRNAAAAEQQARSELDSQVAAAAADVRAAEARAAAAAERAERDKARLRQEIAELQDGRVGLMARLKEMAARKGPAPGAAGAVDASVQTEGARGSGAEQREVGCQVSVVQDALDMVRRALGEGGEGLEITEEEEGVLRDPVSTRIADQALADAEGLPEVAVGEAGRDVLQSWRALMPPVGWGAGVAATVADTQHSVLESVYGLLDGVAEERARSRADLAEKDSQIEALKAALAVAGGDAVKASSSAQGVSSMEPHVNGGVPGAFGTAPAGALPVNNSPLHRPNGVQGIAGEYAGGTVGGGSVVPEIQPAAPAAVATGREHSPWRGLDGGIYYGEGESAGGAGEVNGTGGGSSVPSPGWEHVEGAEAVGGVPQSPVGAPAAAPGGAGVAGVAAAAHATPPKRGWFGGMFGRRTPSPAQARRSILTSD